MRKMVAMVLAARLAGTLALPVLAATETVGGYTWAYLIDGGKAVIDNNQQRKQLAREGQVYWGYNAAGELAPLPMEAICGTTA